jgi:hypothetical protein
MRRVAEERRRRDVEPVRRSQGLGFYQHAIKDHRHGEAEHREEDLAITSEQKPDEKRDEPGCDAAEGHEQKGVRHARAARDKRDAVRADCVVESLAERH